jgi:heme iron utilization protein
MANLKAPEPGAAARRLLRACDRAALATALDSWPFASLVLVATAPDASPLLLISDLSEHSKNIKRENRVSLLLDGTGGLEDPLTGPRATVLGLAHPDEDPLLRQRFLARHPAAALYAGFADFRLYRVAVERAHLVAGFGRIHWIAADALLGGALPPALAAAESDLLRQLNETEAAALPAGGGKGWRLTGVDAEGGDLRRGGSVGRLDFAAPVGDAEGVRRELTRLSRMAGGSI